MTNQTAEITLLSEFLHEMYTDWDLVYGLTYQALNRKLARIAPRAAGAEPVEQRR